MIKKKKKAGRKTNKTNIQKKKTPKKCMFKICKIKL